MNGTFEKMAEIINGREQRSAWRRGVTAYALELLEELKEGVNGGYISADDLNTPADFSRALLNGVALAALELGSGEGTHGDFILRFLGGHLAGEEGGAGGGTGEGKNVAGFDVVAAEPAAGGKISLDKGTGFHGYQSTVHVK